LASTEGSFVNEVRTYPKLACDLELGDFIYGKGGVHHLRYVDGKVEVAFDSFGWGDITLAPTDVVSIVDDFTEGSTL
jgi:hypothetical protein